MQSQAFEEILRDHPSDVELLSYCQKSALSEESISDDEFQKYEGHLLVCDACVQRAKAFEEKLTVPARVLTAGGSLPS